MAQPEPTPAADPSAGARSDAAAGTVGAAGLDVAAARRCVPADALRRLYRPRPARVARDTLATWAVLLGALALAAWWPNPLVWALVFLVVGARQLALSHLLHDASHYNVARDKRWNDWLSDVFFAAPTLISTDAYRAQHRAHHAWLGEVGRDSDLRAWYNIRGWRALRRTAWALFGGEAVKTALSYSHAQPIASLVRQAVLVAGTNGLLLAWCWAFGSPLAYFVLWLLPIFTITVYLLTLRVIAEHQPERYARTGRDAFDASMAPPLARTIEAGPVERFFIGAMNFCYHHEHHLFPGVPYPSLPELHRMLVDGGYYDARPEAVAPSYRTALLGLVHAGRAERRVA